MWSTSASAAWVQERKEGRKEGREDEASCRFINNLPSLLPVIRGRSIWMVLTVPSSFRHRLSRLSGSPCPGCLRVKAGQTVTFIIQQNRNKQKKKSTTQFKLSISVFWATVPWNDLRCAVKNNPILLNWLRQKKHSIVEYFQWNVRLFFSQDIGFVCRFHTGEHEHC